MTRSSARAICSRARPRRVDPRQFASRTIASNAACRLSSAGSARFGAGRHYGRFCCLLVRSWRCRYVHKERLPFSNLEAALSDLLPDPSPVRPTRGPRVRADERPDLPLGNGKFATPRVRWAGKIRVSDRTGRRLVPPESTTFIGGVAHVIEPDATASLEHRGRDGRLRKQPSQRRGQRG